MSPVYTFARRGLGVVIKVGAGIPSSSLLFLFMKKINQTELRKCNGKNGAPICIAYKGKVYDVSNSSLWRGGVHIVFHQAGEDLTGRLTEAPHGSEFLQRFPVIGIFTKSGQE